jgi:hypothetical protein
LPINHNGIPRLLLLLLLVLLLLGPMIDYDCISVLGSAHSSASLLLLWNNFWNSVWHIFSVVSYFLFLFLLGKRIFIVDSFKGFFCFFILIQKYLTSLRQIRCSLGLPSRLLLLTHSILAPFISFIHPLPIGIINLLSFSWIFLGFAFEVIKEAT